MDSQEIPLKSLWAFKNINQIHPIETNVMARNLYFVDDSDMALTLN